MKARLVELKKNECPWLYEVSAHIGQQALVDLEKAFKRFFESLKGGPKSGFPKFKRKGHRDSARLYEVTLEERHLRMPNIGRVRLKETCAERGFEDGSSPPPSDGARIVGSFRSAWNASDSSPRPGRLQERAMSSELTLA